MRRNKVIVVQNINITVSEENFDDYICITDIAKAKVGESRGADVLNVALFGFTAKAWRDENPEMTKKNNMRNFASISELTVLSNLETHNAQIIREGRNKTERFQIL